MILNRNESKILIIHIINRKRIIMYKYYMDILRKNKYAPKFLNEIKQVANKKQFG